MPEIEPVAPGHRHDGIIMRLAEQFSDLPFLTVVSAVRTTAETWSVELEPSMEALERRSAAVLGQLPQPRARRDT